MGALISLGYTLFRPAEYAGRVSFFFPSKVSVLGSNAIVDNAGGGAAAVLSGGGPNSLRVYEAFLTSETAVRDIAGANRLRREAFVRKRTLEDDARANVLTVTFYDQDKERNLSVLRSHVKELAKINAKVSFATSQDDINVLKRRLRDAEASLKIGEDDVIRYERSLVSAPAISSGSSGAITVTPQAWAADLDKLRLEAARVDNELATSRERVRMLASVPRDTPSELPPVKRLGPAMEKAEYDLALKRLTLGPESPEIRRLEKSISVLHKQMEREIRTYLNGVNAGIIDPSVTEGSLPQLLVQKASLASQIDFLSRLANVAPAESVKLSQRYRKLALQTAVIQQLTSQVLEVTLQAQRDPNRWVVLDDPWIDEKPSNKSYGRMGLAGLLIGLIIGSAVAIYKREGAA